MCVSASRSAIPWVIAFALVLVLLAPYGAKAAGSGLESAAVGVWELKLDNDSRKCRLMLRADAVPPGYGLGMPPVCRLAFPFMADVHMWMDAGGGKVRFGNAGGDPLMVFEPGDGGLLSGTGPEGEVLHLAPLGHHREAPVKTSAAQAVVLAGAAAVKPPVTEPVLAKLPVPTTAEMAGHYGVLRKLGKDTGCMITLDDKTRGPGGSLKANLAPACRDQGIVIFDPVGWQLQAGHLVLTARKGHTTRLDLQGDGSWIKDAKEGANLALKKM